MKVKDIMTSPALFVSKDSNLLQAAKTMRDNDIGVIPVCDDGGGVIGIITDRDIVIRGIDSGKSFDQIKASDIMSNDVITVSPMTDLDDVYEIMSDIQVRRLPVVDKTSLVGMVTLGDLSQSIDYSFETADVLCDVCRGCCEDEN
jgi:CBS domain-containing protein